MRCFALGQDSWGCHNPKQSALGSPKDRRKAQPQRPTEMGRSQLLQLTSLAKEGLCTCLIWRERLQVMAVLL